MPKRHVTVGKRFRQGQLVERLALTLSVLSSMHGSEDFFLLFFFFLAPFFRDWVSVSCFTGQLPGIGTVFILASLQMCKVQRQSPLASQGGWGGRRLESAGSGGSCARRSLRVGGSPSRL